MLNFFVVTSWKYFFQSLFKFFIKLDFTFLWQITDLPPGRLPIETRIVEGDKNGIEKVYKVILFPFKSLSLCSKFQTGFKGVVVFVLLLLIVLQTDFVAVSGAYECLFSLHFLVSLKFLGNLKGVVSFIDFRESS